MTLPNTSSTTSLTQSNSPTSTSTSTSTSSSSLLSSIATSFSTLSETVSSTSTLTSSPTEEREDQTLITYTVNEKENQIRQQCEEFAENNFVETYKNDTFASSQNFLRSIKLDIVTPEPWNGGYQDIWRIGYNAIPVKPNLPQLKAISDKFKLIDGLDREMLAKRGMLDGAKYLEENSRGLTKVNYVSSTSPEDCYVETNSPFARHHTMEKMRGNGQWKFIFRRGGENDKLFVPTSLVFPIDFTTTGRAGVCSLSTLETEDGLSVHPLITINVLAKFSSRTALARTYAHELAHCRYKIKHFHDTILLKCRGGELKNSLFKSGAISELYEEAKGCNPGEFGFTGGDAIRSVLHYGQLSEDKVNIAPDPLKDPIACVLSAEMSNISSSQRNDAAQRPFFNCHSLAKWAEQKGGNMQATLSACQKLPTIQPNQLCQYDSLPLAESLPTTTSSLTLTSLPTASQTPTPTPSASPTLSNTSTETNSARLPVTDLWQVFTDSCTSGLVIQMSDLLSEKAIKHFLPQGKPADTALFIKDLTKALATYAGLTIGAKERLTLMATRLPPILLGPMAAFICASILFSAGNNTTIREGILRCSNQNEKVKDFLDTLKSIHITDFNFDRFNWPQPIKNMLRNICGPALSIHRLMEVITYSIVTGFEPDNLVSYGKKIGAAAAGYALGSFIADSVVQGATAGMQWLQSRRQPPTVIPPPALSQNRDDFVIQMDSMQRSPRSPASLTL